jgi:hypothetical protein
MAPLSFINGRATRAVHSFLLVRCRRGQSLPVAFALKGLVQPDRIEHIRGPYDIVAKLSIDSDSDFDSIYDLPGVESFVRLEAIKPSPNGSSRS